MSAQTTPANLVAIVRDRLDDILFDRGQSDERAVTASRLLRIIEDTAPALVAGWLCDYVPEGDPGWYDKVMRVASALAAAGRDTNAMWVEVTR